MLPLAQHAAAGAGEAVRIAGRSLDYAQLAALAADLVGEVGGATRVAVWATPGLETCAAVAGALAAGIPLVPVNPRIGGRELAHVLADSGVDLVVCGPGTDLPAPLAALDRIEVRLDGVSAGGHTLPPEPPPETPALVLYTSGTTGPPKGTVLPRRAVASNLDALAQVWEWTAGDVLVHALPLFHVHGLVLGLLGPLRLGGQLHLLGRFTAAAVAGELAAEATMAFGVPTMYHRLALDATADATVAAALRRARLLVSGSAALPIGDSERITRATGATVIERYGMTETLIVCAAYATGPRRPGTVGPPLPGVELRLVADAGSELRHGEQTPSEIEVRGPNLFLGYLNQPVATARAFRGGWLRTGDIATRDAEGSLRILGRRATDLISSGGYRIGAGEVETVLLQHPAVAEAAVVGEPDDDLGERVVAWLVLAPGAHRPGERELADHVAQALAPHKRPRAVRWLDALPRNELGKVLKSELSG